MVEQNHQLSMFPDHDPAPAEPVDIDAWAARIAANAHPRPYISQENRELHFAGLDPIPSHIGRTASVEVSVDPVDESPTVTPVDGIKRTLESHKPKDYKPTPPTQMDRRVERRKAIFDKPAVK